MEKELKITDFKTDDVEQETVNFVVDSNAVISFWPDVDVNNYIKTFLKVLTIYYNTMWLRINSDKTNILVISKPKHKAKADTIILETDLEKI